MATDTIALNVRLVGACNNCGAEGWGAIVRDDDLPEDEADSFYCLVCIDAMWPAGFPAGVHTVSAEEE